jgi:ribose 5-phosphate isomerase B
MSITIAIGVDHRGFELKKYLVQQSRIGAFDVVWYDVGTSEARRTDYPLYVEPVCSLIKDKIVDFGVLACGTGIGMTIAANRFKGIYAGLVWNETIARLAKEDDNVNVLVLPADFIDQAQGLIIIEAWLSAKFKGGRYAQRIALID